MPIIGGRRLTRISPVTWVKDGRRWIFRASGVEVGSVYLPARTMRVAVAQPTGRDAMYCWTIRTKGGKEAVGYMQSAKWAKSKVERLWELVLKGEEIFNDDRR